MKPAPGRAMSVFPVLPQQPRWNRADKAGDSFEVTGIEAVDDYKVIITLKEPFAPFISLLTMPACYVLPEKNNSEIAESKFFEKRARFRIFFKTLLKFSIKFSF